MAASSPECTLRRFVDEIVSETDGASIYCQCTPMPIGLLRPDASVYPAGLLNSYAAQIASALETGITTFTGDIQGALT